MMVVEVIRGDVKKKITKTKTKTKTLSTQDIYKSHLKSRAPLAVILICGRKIRGIRRHPCSPAAVVE